MKNDSLSEFEAEQPNEYTQRLLKAALETNTIKSANLDKTMNQAAVHDIVSILTEHFSDFLIVGHDYSGRRMNWMQVSNPKDADALQSLAVKTIQNGPPI